MAMRRGHQHRILVLRKTTPAARKSVLPLIRHYLSRWNLDKICKLNKTDMSFRFEDESEIILTGLDDPEKIKSIFGITSIWLEEANEFTKDDFLQLNLRMRGQMEDYYQMMMSFNPISRNTWLYEVFFDPDNEENWAKPRADARLHHSTYKDNKFLDDYYRDQLEDLINQDKTYHQVYALGEWGVLEGLIYNNYTTIEEMPNDVVPIYGIDFGYNAPSTVVAVAKRDKELFLEEMLYRTGMTNTNLIAWIHRNVPEGAIIYADSAEPDRIEEMKRAGLNVRPAWKGKNSVRDGIDYCKRHKLTITENSTNLLKEIGGYKWKQDREGNIIDEPVKFADHAMDAMRYAAYTHWAHPQTELKIVLI